MHSIKFNNAPEPFDNTWMLNANMEHEYELGYNNEFVLPAPRIEFLKKPSLFTRYTLLLNLLS